MIKDNSSENLEWPLTTQELAVFLGVSDVTVRRTKQDHNIKLIPGEDTTTKPNKKPIKWTKKGALKIATHLHTEEANKFKKANFGGKILLFKPEHHYINIIMKAVDGFTTCEKQYSCNSYKIDLFFPELKLAFECDENHHNYNQKKDMIREEKISDNLTCKFIRFNPNDDNIGDVINIIFCKIFNKEIPEKIIKI